MRLGFTTVGLNQHLRACTVAEARHLRGLVLPRDRLGDRLELQHRLMDRDNGVEFVDDNRIDMRNRAFDHHADGGGSAASMQMGTGFDVVRVADRLLLTPSMRRALFASHESREAGPIQRIVTRAIDAY
jgi:hypothetical protein